MSADEQRPTWPAYPPFSDNPELAKAILEWIDQGRSDEAIHGVLNFFSGKGIKWLEADRATAATNARREGMQDVRNHLASRWSKSMEPAIALIDKFIQAALDSHPEEAE